MRARDLGIPFDGIPGSQNAITDVPGLTVGHTTCVEGDSIRTGVTAVLPRGNEMPASNVPAGIFALNGNGEMTGSHWVEESGFLSGPVMVTNTHSVGVVRDAVVTWLDRREPPDTFYGFHLPVVAETYDGVLNDIQRQVLTPEHAFHALDSATPGAVAEGNVGGGTGMVTHRFKGGIGTASRQVETGNARFTVGTLVQSNYGERDMLTVAGVPAGRHLTGLLPVLHPSSAESGDGSIIIIIATDAPLLPHQCKRMARRAAMGLARVGGAGFDSSGDIFIAFSTRAPERSGGMEQWRTLSNSDLDPLFRAVIESVEESIVNALVAARTMTGFRGNTVHALPHGELVEVLRKYGRIPTQ